MLVYVAKCNWCKEDGSEWAEEEKEKFLQEVRVELDADLSDSGWQGLLKKSIMAQLKK